MGNNSFSQSGVWTGPVRVLRARPSRPLEQGLCSFIITQAGENTILYFRRGQEEKFSRLLAEIDKT